MHGPMVPLGTRADAPCPGEVHAALDAVPFVLGEPSGVAPCSEASRLRSATNLVALPPSIDAAFSGCQPLIRYGPAARSKRLPPKGAAIPAATKP